MKKIFYLIVIIVILIVIMVSVFKGSELENNISMENVSVQTKNGQEYYIIDGIYNGEYDLQYLDFMQHYAEWYAKNAPSFSDWYNNSVPVDQWDSISIPQDANIDASDIVPFDTEKIATYEEYVNFCDKWDISQKYNNQSQKYIIYSKISFRPYGHFLPKLAGIKYIKDKVELYILDYPGRSATGLSGYVYIIPLDENINTVSRKRMITKEEFDTMPEFSIN